MMRPTWILCAAAGIALPVAGADRVACPILLDEGTVAVVRPPAGWLGTSHSIMRLTGGGIMRGHPDQMAYLVPSASKRTKGGGITTWTFESGEKRWLWCSYGGSGAIQLSKRLDDSAGDCSVHFRTAEKDQIVDLYAACTAPSARR
ncbi:MAG TPA: STY0301 family protein [Telluria sp.]|nr:STY0301 family protein [Telluria sp.]